jgi:hypothetical protein
MYDMSTMIGEPPAKVSAIPDASLVYRRGRIV